MRFDITNFTDNVGEYTVQRRVKETVEMIRALPDSDPRKHFTALAVTQQQKDTFFEGIDEFNGYPLEVL